MRLLPALIAGVVFSAAAARGEQCITQSQMQPAERESLVRAGTNLAQLTAANKPEAVRAETMPQFAQAFTGIADAIRDASPHLAGASFVPQTVWILDASTVKAGPDGSPQDAQFFCTLNRGNSQTGFLIPALPAGRYGLVILDTAGIAEPWQVAMLLRQSAPGTWQLGGLFPRATTAAGRDGLWYWRAARDFASRKQPWNAFVYYNEAEQLLKPVSFLSSGHLEALESERSKAAPPALSGGIGTAQPLVISNGSGVEVRVTSLGAEASPDSRSNLDLLVHVVATEALADPAASRARNAAAAKALVKVYPELRSAFHGVWVVADLPSGGTYISEEPMTSL